MTKDEFDKRYADITVSQALNALDAIVNLHCPDEHIGQAIVLAPGSLQSGHLECRECTNETCVAWPCDTLCTILEEMEKNDKNHA